MPTVITILFGVVLGIIAGGWLGLRVKPKRFPAYAETAFRACLFGDEVERLQHFDPLTGELLEDDVEHVAIWPATHYNVKEGTIESAVQEIGRELNERCEQLESEGKQLESHRLRQRTQYDMEMLREMGFCSGI